MKKDDIKLDEGYEPFSEGPKFEFPREIFSLTKESEDLLKDNKDNKAKNTDFESLLLELNKQVSDADTSVAALVSQKEELNNRKLQIEEDEKKLSNERFSFEQEMKNEKLSQFLGAYTFRTVPTEPFGLQACIAIRHVKLIDAGGTGTECSRAYPDRYPLCRFLCRRGQRIPHRIYRCPKDCRGTGPITQRADWAGLYHHRQPDRGRLDRGLGCGFYAGCRAGRPGAEGGVLLL